MKNAETVVDKLRERIEQNHEGYDSKDLENASDYDTVLDIEILKKIEKLKNILDNVSEILNNVSHIPFYAYGDNQAACEMSETIGRALEIILERE